MEWEPESLSVSKLFGQKNHSFQVLLLSPVTVIAGPNGCGKTHVLKLIRAFMAVDFGELIALPYESACLVFRGGASVTATRNVEVETTTLKIQTGDMEGNELSFEVTSDEFNVDDVIDLPGWIRKTDSGRWIDERADRFVTSRELERRYGITVGAQTNRQKLMAANPVLKSLGEIPSPTFIDTKRLDSHERYSRGEDNPYFVGQPSPSSARAGVGRIGQYITQVRLQISEARRESLSRSQDADEKFASNLLKRSRKIIKQSNLIVDYDRLSKLSDELSENGLAGKVVSVTIPPNSDATERRVLDLFLQDWSTKLEPLLPVHRKLTALKRIVNGKFIGKTIYLDPRGVLHFRSIDGSEVRVDSLSSGEQHLLALFTLLLFSAAYGSVVLIDEPEISLHAAWKHSFISDIEEVASLIGLTVIFATHSTAVINGRWELVQEIGVSDHND